MLKSKWPTPAHWSHSSQQNQHFLYQLEMDHGNMNFSRTLDLTNLEWRSLWKAFGSLLCGGLAVLSSLCGSSQKKTGKEKDKLQPVKTDYSLSSSRHLTVQWQVACRSLCPLHKEAEGAIGLAAHTKVSRSVTECVSCGSTWYPIPLECIRLLLYFHLQILV